MVKSEAFPYFNNAAYGKTFSPIYIRFCLKIVLTKKCCFVYFIKNLTLDNLIPTLYLKGISTGDFTEALSAILGEKASTIVRLKKQWEEEYTQWPKPDLSNKYYVYF